MMTDLTDNNTWLCPKRCGSGTFRMYRHEEKCVQCGAPRTESKTSEPMAFIERALERIRQIPGIDPEAFRVELNNGRIEVMKVLGSVSTTYLDDEAIDDLMLSVRLATP